MPREARARADVRAGVVVPLRSFTDAKARLAPVLDPAGRAELARCMAERVIEAAGSLELVVVSSAPEVREWAGDRSITVVDDPGRLDAAAAAGRDHLRDLGCGRVVIAHGDLPHARSLEPLATDGDDAVAAMVPCHHDDGTNVLSVPAAHEFRFAYGPGSFRRHLAEADRVGLGIRVVRPADLAFDVDTPEDLARVGAPCR